VPGDRQKYKFSQRHKRLGKKQRSYQKNSQTQVSEKFDIKIIDCKYMLKLGHGSYFRKEVMIDC
jgi:hypothetical protein